MQFYRKHVNFERKLGFGRPYTPNPICFYRNLVFHFNKTFSKGEKVTHNKIHLQWLYQIIHTKAKKNIYSIK